MTAVSLFPRLDPLAFEQCMSNIDEMIANSAQPLVEDRLPAGTGWTAIGGAQISLAVLGELRKLLLAVASTCGFPERGSIADRAKFDALATAALADFGPLDSGEADRDDVWAFLTTVLAPDVVAWRFVNRSPDRYLGGVRNAFQRLWMRARALDRGADAAGNRWELVERLTEDALVQITERPSLGADQRLSRAIAENWILTAESIGLARMEDVMRKAIIDLRIRNEIQILSTLDAELLMVHVKQIFRRAAGLEHATEVLPPVISTTELATQESATLPPTATSSTAKSRNDAGAKTGELAIQHAILELMLDGQQWSNGQLKSRLAGILPLTKVDKGVGARPSEELWENRVNNALGRARASSLYAKAFVENCGHGLHMITPAGKAYILEDDDHADAEQLLRLAGHSTETHCSTNGE